MSRTGFLLAEDEAVKQRFSNLKVYDDRDVARPVQVFFRYPEGETERTYPFITIEHIDIVHARNRQHSENIIYYKTDGSGGSAGPVTMSYWPSVSKDFSFITDKNDYEYLAANEHVPVDLLYQVSTFSRTALHDRQLSAQMLTKVVPFRQGFIEIPADGTMRRFDLLDWTTADLLDPEAGYRKRIFRKVYTLQMTAEIPSSAIYGVHSTESVAITIRNTTNGTTESVST